MSKFTGMTLKQALLAVALQALALVSGDAITSAKRSVASHTRRLESNHTNPTGSDVKRTLAIWGDSGAIATMLAASGFEPKTLVKRVWNYASECKAQRSGVDYLALKAQDKFLALCAAIVSGDIRVAWNRNKYSVPIVMLCEALNVSEIDNASVYALYTSNASRIEALAKSVDDVELRQRLIDSELYKSESTASTQRTTSANLFQILGAGENAGNEQVIRVDKASDAYQKIRAAILDH